MNEAAHLQELLDLKVINNLKLLDDPEELKSIVDTFISETQEDVRRLHSLMDFEDTQAMGVLIHKMKGTSGIMGASGMAKELDSIHEWLNRNNIGDATRKEIRKHYRAFLENWESTKVHIYHAFGCEES